MSILEALNTLIGGLGIPVETGIFSEKAPDEYIVITPMSDTFEVFADNLPQYETQEARLSLYSKGNYMQRKRQIVKALLVAGITVTERRYIGYEDDTGYHHYAIDAAKEYEMKEE
jgi:hypothetical protein